MVYNRHLLAHGGDWGVVWAKKGAIFFVEIEKECQLKKPKEIPGRTAKEKGFSQTNGAKGEVKSKGLWQRLKLEFNALFLSNLRTVLPWMLNESQSPKTRGVTGSQDVRWSRCFEPPQTHFPLPPQNKSVLFCQLRKTQFHHRCLISRRCALAHPAQAGPVWRWEACCHLGGPKLLLASCSSASFKPNPSSARTPWELFALSSWFVN